MQTIIIQLSQKETILEPLPKEPLTFTSTAATPKNIPIEMKISPPEIITKEWRPITQLKNSKTGFPIKTFYVYATPNPLPNPKELVERVAKKPTIFYQPTPNINQPPTQ